jgi:VanZ family protein
MLLPERVVRALSLSVAIAMAAFVLVGARKVGEVGSVPGPYLDKVVHALYYGVMAILFDRGLGGRLPVVAMAIAIAVGGADEIHQMSVPTRDASALDWVADVTGAVVLTLLWRAARRAGGRRT